MKTDNLKRKSDSDWEHDGAEHEEDMDYSDIPELGAELIDKAFLVPTKKLVTIRLDSDVVVWLKRNGKGYQTRANKILRTIMEAQENSARKKASGE